MPQARTRSKTSSAAGSGSGASVNSSGLSSTGWGEFKTQAFMSTSDCGLFLPLPLGKGWGEGLRSKRPPRVFLYSRFGKMKIRKMSISSFSHRPSPRPSPKGRGRITSQSLALLAQHFDRQGNRGDRADNQQRQPCRVALIFVELVSYQQTNPQPERDACAADEHQFGNGYLSLFQFHPLGSSCFAMRFGS